MPKLDNIVAVYTHESGKDILFVDKNCKTYVNVEKKI